MKKKQKVDLVKLQEHHAKILNDLIVEFAFYHSKETTNEGRRFIFDDYNGRWFEHCHNNKNNKNISLQYKGFVNIAGNNRKLNKIKGKLGIHKYNP